MANKKRDTNGKFVKSSAIKEVAGVEVKDPVLEKVAICTKDYTGSSYIYLSQSGNDMVVLTRAVGEDITRMVFELDELKHLPKAIKGFNKLLKIEKNGKKAKKK